MNKLIEIKSVSKLYDKGLVRALENIDLTLEVGKSYALMGSSGCGKSTLLNIIGSLDEASSGEVYYDGKTIKEIKNLTLFRREFIGFVFQFHHLIPVLTLRENIEAALLPNTKITKDERESRTFELLEKLNITHRSNSYSANVSGGERQRAAIARALINTPKLLLADEPTGNVDSLTAQSILETMFQSAKENNTTMLIATHDHDIAKMADVLIKMKDGKIISITHA